MQPQDPKTLGQIGYEAYCEKSGWKSLASGADLPPFSDTKPEIQEAWEAAAQAVAQNVLPAGIGSATSAVGEAQGEGEQKPADEAGVGGEAEGDAKAA